jgi:hypothetical protein
VSLCAGGRPLRPRSHRLSKPTPFGALHCPCVRALLCPQANLSLSGRDVFSHSCMVTPEISGLMNGDVLTALGNNCITCSTGDNTWWGPRLGAGSNVMCAGRDAGLWFCRDRRRKKPRVDRACSRLQGTPGQPLASVF